MKKDTHISSGHRWRKGPITSGQRKPNFRGAESLYDLDKWPIPPEKWRRRWHPTPVLLPGKSHGRRSQVGSSPWGREESDTTEWRHFHFSLLCTGEGNGNPLQCSWLENPRDGGAWWAAVYGVAQSRTRLKWLSSSSSSPEKSGTVHVLTSRHLHLPGL